jgi:hypothetical protein
MSKLNNYSNFIKESKEYISIPELNTISDLDKYLHHPYTTADIGGDDYKIIDNRDLTKKEWKLVNVYIYKFESCFILSEDVIIDRLTDVTDEGFLQIKIHKMLSPMNLNIKLTEFDARKEIKDINSLISMKRWYDNYTNIEIKPVHHILIENHGKNSRLPFDSKKIHQIIVNEVKPFFESYTDCKVEVDRGGDYSMSMKIIYPKVIII